MNDKEKEFLAKYRELCQKYQMAIVPTFESKPSAHDPMTVVALDYFWMEYINQEIYTHET